MSSSQQASSLGELIIRASSIVRLVMPTSTLSGEILLSLTQPRTKELWLWSYILGGSPHSTLFNN